MVLIKQLQAILFYYYHNLLFFNRIRRNRSLYIIKSISFINKAEYDFCELITNI